MTVISRHRVQVDTTAQLNLWRKIRKRQADGLDFDWRVVELPRTKTTKMEDTFVGTHVLSLSVKDPEARIVRLGDIFDGEM
jgi:hypothetical protein